MYFCFINRYDISVLFVMIYIIKLIKVKCIGENSWEKTSLMTVSFASLITENAELNPLFDLRT